MDRIAHSTYALIVYYFMYFLIWRSYPPSNYSWFVIIFGNLPDIDGIFWLLKKKPYDNTFQHHLFSWWHWPISYSWTIGLFLLALVFDYYPSFFLLIVVGIYSHMIADSITSGDGLMWGKIPWKKGQFGSFINLWSSKTDGYHGFYYNVRWQNTWTNRITIVITFMLIAWLIFIQFDQGFIFAYFLILLYFAGLLLGLLIRIDPKFKLDPPNGRFDDYRRNLDYRAWMEKNGYSLNTHMHVVRKKTG
jgi:uncharacterized membrane protein